MDRKASKWTPLPPDTVSLLLAPVLIMVFVAATNMVLSLVTTCPISIWVATGIALIGAVLLFFARLPLYRERNFLSTGAKELDDRHRRIYRLAYTLIVPSILFMLLALFVTTMMMSRR